MSKKDTHFLFYSQNFNENTILLDSDEVGHISNVLRFAVGDEIRITDGLGNIFESKIVKMKKDSALCEIISTTFHPPLSCQITLAVGLPEKEKLEDICESLTPLGVKKIVPLITQRCQKNYSDERWEKVAQRCRRKIISSIKQSLNPYITSLENPIELTKFATDCDLNLLCDFDGKPVFEIIEKDNLPQKICVFVGPPAGFSQEEIDSVAKKSAKIRLGNYRLRTELAAIGAVSAVGQFL